MRVELYGCIRGTVKSEVHRFYCAMLCSLNDGNILNTHMYADLFLRLGLPSEPSKTLCNLEDFKNACFSFPCGGGGDFGKLFKNDWVMIIR